MSRGMIELAWRAVAVVDAVLLCLGITWSIASAGPLVMMLFAGAPRRS